MCCYMHWNKTNLSSKSALNLKLYECDFTSHLNLNLVELYNKKNKVKLISTLFQFKMRSSDL